MLSPMPAIAPELMRPAFPAAGVRLQAEVDRREVDRVDHAVPADAGGMQPVDPLAANVGDPRPFRPEQPLVTVRREAVDRHSVAHRAERRRATESHRRRRRRRAAGTVRQSAARSLRNPLANSTELIARTRVRASMASRMSAMSTRLPRLGTGRASTPRSREVHPRILVGRVFLGRR